jgi:pimeloyl-ACP methyl ester carboxylesterase
MEKVYSSDGTVIAFDKLGAGPPVILVCGAFSYRAFPMTVKIAENLAETFTVYNYDRRGRGDSTDTAPYAIEREIEDLQALIEHAGGSAYVWGLSSGAVLSLRAVAAGLNIKKLAVYQPPFNVEDNGKLPPSDLAKQLEGMIAEDRRNDAVKYMMTKGMGAPGFAITMMRLFPVWSRLKAVANTLPYDAAIMQDTLSGKPLSAAEWAPVTVPTLVLDGEKGPASARQAAEALAKVLPDGRHHTLKGQGHVIAAESLGPVLVEFFTN